MESNKQEIVNGSLKNGEVDVFQTPEGGAEQGNADERLIKIEPVWLPEVKTTSETEADCLESQAKESIQHLGMKLDVDGVPSIKRESEFINVSSLSIKSEISEEEICFKEEHVEGIDEETLVNASNQNIKVELKDSSSDLGSRVPSKSNAGAGTICDTEAEEVSTDGCFLGPAAVLNKDVGLLTDLDGKNRITSTGKTTFQCNNCQNYFSRRTSLVRHMLVHNKENTTHKRSYQCEKCSKSYTEAGSLRRHAMVHSGKEKDVDCPVCPKKFWDVHRMREHYKSHFNKFECKICGKVFNQMRNYKAHVVIHTQDGRFHCKFCTRCFASRSSLNKHLNIHEGVKFQCNICEKLFGRQYNLKIHMADHSGKKAYPCPLCPKKFSQRHHLQRHSFIHTSKLKQCVIPIYQCASCPRTFNDRHSLVRHVKRHMPTIESINSDNN